MDKRTWIAVALGLLVFVGWQQFFGPKPDTAPSNEVEQAITPVQNNAPEENAPFAETSAGLPVKKETISVTSGELVLTNEFLLMSDWKLARYHVSREADAPSVSLDRVTQVARAVEMNFDRADLLYLKNVRGQLTQEGNQYTWAYEDARVSIRKVFVTEPASPYFQLSISADFKKDPPRFAFLSVRGKNLPDDPDAQFRKLEYYTDKAVVPILLSSEILTSEIKTPIKWIGLSSRYFLFSLIPEQPSPEGFIQSFNGPKSGDARIGMSFPLTTEGKLRQSVRVFFGPKEISLLKSVEPTLDLVVDFGWFSWVGYFLLTVMNTLFGIVKNYGVAIILITIILKIVTFPLNYKSMKSMKAMQLINPEIQRLREKYKKDPQKLNKEMMELMKSRGYNPMAGCLPILVQMPVFIALYQVLLNSVELYQAPFAFWIQDLSIKDPYYITPILMTVAMWGQQKLSPQPATDPAQRRMMQLMPLIFGAFMVTLPAGLTVYMLTNVLASVIQQLILNRKLDLKPNVEVLPAKG